MAGIARQLTIAVIAIVAAAGASRAADPDALRTTVEQANTLLADGKADEALAVYSKSLEQAGINAPAELVYDNACALLAAGKLPEAEAGFRTIAARESGPLAASAAYNLGLIEAKRAETSVQTAAPEAIEALRRAERQFRTAVAANPDDQAAAKNIDLVQRRIAAIQKKQEDQKKQDQKQKQDQQKKDGKQDQSKTSDKNGDPSQSSEQNKQQGDNNLSNDLNDLAKKQDQQSKDSHDLNDKAQQGKPKDDLAKDQAEAAKKQEDLRKKTEDAKKKADSQSDKAQSQQEKDAMDKAKQSLDKAQEAQKQAEEKLKNGDAKSAEELQKQAAEKLRDAAQQARQGEDAKKQQEEQQEAQAQKQEQGEKQGDKPFDATAAQILDQEKKIKEAIARMQRQRAKPAPVAKDW